MVVLAASICTRGGKAVLSRQFREMPRSRVEALLASFPKMADNGTQHTTVERDNVRFVYQPLDELYMVLITNRQSNILQDIDSLHLFAQVVTNTCKSLEEREILKHAYELLSAFDELVTLGYRENLTISQIKTFLEMDSHEERVQEMISRNKEIDANEERKKKAKQLDMQRKEAARSGRSATSRGPTYPTYTTPIRSAPTDTFDSYEAEKNKYTQKKPTVLKVAGMQLGKKSKTNDMLERVRSEIGALETTVPPSQLAAAAITDAAESRASAALGRDAIHVTFTETIGAKLSRDGIVNSLTINGDLHLRISDPSLTKLKILLKSNADHGVMFRTHPLIDRAVFNNSKMLQLSGTRGFPVNNTVAVLRWRASPKVDDPRECPISFTVWINQDTERYSVTVEYELTGGDPLMDVIVSIPFQGESPVVSTGDANYNISDEALEWHIGSVTEENSSGSLEFETATSGENDFFPMTVGFSKSSTCVDIDIASMSLLDVDEEMDFSKVVKCTAQSYLIE